MTAIAASNRLAERATEASDRLIWWIIGALAALVMAMGSMAYAQLRSDLATLAQASSSRAERLAALEARQNNVDGRLASIDAKLDRILDRSPAGR